MSMSMNDSSKNTPTTSGRLLSDEQLATWLDEIDVPDHNRLDGVREALEGHIAAQARAGRTLGRIVEDQCRDVLAAIGGAPDLIDEDGDGDWAVVWERLAELRPERDAALARAAELEAQLETNWAVRNRVTQFAARTVKALRTDIAVLQRELDLAQSEWRKAVTDRAPRIEALAGMQRKLRVQGNRITKLTTERHALRADLGAITAIPQRHIIGIDWTPERIAALANDPGTLTVVPPEVGELIGYTVAVTRDHRSGDTFTEIVGTVHSARESAENHLDFCQAMAERHAAKGWERGTYRLVEVHAALPAVEAS